MEIEFFDYKPMIISYISRSRTFIIQHLPLNKVRVLLIEARLFVLVIFYYVFKEARLLFFWSSLFDIWEFTNLLTQLSLGHDSDTMLDEHDSPQWYDIVHFELKLSWLCFGFSQKAS